MGKGENAGNQHFLLFPQGLLLYQRQKLSFVLHLFCRLQLLSIWTRFNFCCLGMGCGSDITETVLKAAIQSIKLYPFPNKPWFLRVCSTSLLKTLQGKREIARNEQFLLFPQCFLSVWRAFCHFQ